MPPFTLNTNVRYNLITDDVSILLSMWWPYASETSAGQVALRFVGSLLKPVVRFAGEGLDGEGCKKATIYSL